jgi:low temperature requirement protein LtrA
VLIALGLKKVLEYVGDGTHHELSEALPILPLASMFGGVALFLLGEVAFKYRVVRTVTVHRVATVALLLALIPLGARMPALAALAVLAAVLVGLIAYESVRFAERRPRLAPGSRRLTRPHESIRRRQRVPGAAP